MLGLIWGNKKMNSDGVKCIIDEISEHKEINVRVTIGIKE